MDMLPYFLGRLATAVDLDEIGNIIGGGDSGTPQYEVLWNASLSGFTFNEDIGAYTAPYTGELPAIESGAYKFEINGEIVDGLVTEPTAGATVISAYSQDIGQIALTFGMNESQVLSFAEIPNIDIKILKTDEVVDYCLLLGSLSNIDHATNFYLYLPASYGFVTDEYVSPGDAITGMFKITIATNDGSFRWEPSYYTHFSIAENYPFMIEFSIENGVSTELENVLKNNTPVTVTISQDNGVTKVITDNYVAGNKYLYCDANIFYRWGNGGFII